MALGYMQSTILSIAISSAHKLNVSSEITSWEAEEFGPRVINNHTIR